MFENPRIEESPQRQPGYCRGCRATSLAREWIMDLDIDDEDHPGYAIQLCNFCVQRIAELAGYQKFELLQQMNVAEMDELREENERLNRVDRVLGLLGLDSDRIIRIGILAGLTDSEAESPDAESDSPRDSGEGGTPGDGGSKSEGTSSLRVKRSRRTVESSNDEDLGAVHSGTISNSARDGSTEI